MLNFIKKYFHRPKEKLLLITGCGRSGTTYICKLLAKNGINIEHESEGVDGTASWTMNAEEAKKTPCGPPLKDYHFKYTLHQVRNPINVIASCFTISDVSWHFIKRYVPIKNSDSKLIMAAKYWYYWNIMAEKKSIFTYRIEDIEIVLPKIISIIGRSSFDRNSLINVSKKTNSRVHGEINIQEIEKEDKSLYDNIIKLANKYGYSQEELGLLER